MTLSHDRIITRAEHEEFRAWTHDHQDYAHVISLIKPARPGVVGFITILEYYHFPPGTPSNMIFECHTIELLDGIYFNVASLPKEHRLLMERVARNCGLVLRRGVPKTYDDKAVTRFPIDTPYSYWTENIIGHPARKCDPAIDKLAHDREHEFAGRIWQGERPDTSTFMKHLYGE